MNIVYCIPDTYRPGGIERVISIKANYLADILHYNVFIITTGQKNNPSYYQFSPEIKFFDLEINFDEIRGMSLGKRFLLRRRKRKEHEVKLRKLLLQLSADIVISTFTHEARFLTKIQDGSKKILELHFQKGFRRKFAKAFKSSLIEKIGYWYASFIDENYYVKKYDLFVVLTEEDKAMWNKTVKNVVAIPNILSFYPKEKAILDDRKVIAVGRLDAQKGFDKLIKIWSLIHDKCPDWHLEIFGSGSDKNKLEVLIARYNLGSVIKINPPVQDIVKYYIESSIFVTTSRYEGMPMALLESMACGLPGVAYKFKCGPRDIISDGIDGFLVDEDDEITFAEKLILLMQNTQMRKSMGQAAKQNVLRYSADTVMRKWNDVFIKLSQRNYN